MALLQSIAESLLKNCMMLIYNVNTRTYWMTHKKINIFRNSIKVSNSLDLDQTRRFVGPDLGPNCSQKLSADDTGRERVNLKTLCERLHTHKLCKIFKIKIVILP